MAKKLLENRILSLILTFAMAVFIAYALINLSCYILAIFNVPSQYEDTAFRAMLYAFPPLPLLLLIWFFRHNDAQENLFKQQENLRKQQQNLHQNALFEAQKLMVAPNDSSKLLAISKLRQLLNDVPEFEKEIYDALSAGLKQHPDWNKKLSLNIKMFDPKKIFFERTDLQYEDLNDVNLEKINFRHVKLQNAIVTNTSLQGSILQDAQLQDTHLLIANLQGCNLKKAQLMNAYLDNANLQKVNLQGANLQGAKLMETNCQNADLQFANLEKTRFEHADLKNAKLQHADLANAYFKDTDLRGADLYEAHLQNTHLNGAIFDDNTIFPEGQKGADYKEQANERYQMYHENELSPKELEELNNRGLNNKYYNRND